MGRIHSHKRTLIQAPSRHIAHCPAVIHLELRWVGLKSLCKHGMITPRARSATRAGRDNKARVYRLLGGAEARRYRQQKKIDFECMDIATKTL